LFVLVNPFGGKRCANKIYEAEVKPMLEAADVEITMQGFSTQMRIFQYMIFSVFPKFLANAVILIRLVRAFRFRDPVPGACPGVGHFS
jgi:hypothetical protein